MGVGNEVKEQTDLPYLGSGLYMPNVHLADMHNTREGGGQVGLKGFRAVSGGCACAAQGFG
jgi:hypothetical protein